MKLRFTLTILLSLVAVVAFAQDDVQKMVDELCKEVEDYTGLKFKKQVPAALQSREDFGKFVKEEMDKSYPKEKAAALTAYYQLLGWAPEGYDLTGSMAELITSQAGAYYEPTKDHIYMLMGKPGDKMFKIILFHELVHALQDQYNDIGKSMEALDKSGDEEAISAFRFVVEGEATYWMTLYGAGQKDLGSTGEFIFNLQRNLTTKQIVGLSKLQAQMMKDQPDMAKGAEVLEKTPAILVRQLTDAYQKGAYLIYKVYDKGGMDACRKLCDAPPPSTRDAMYPVEWMKSPRPTVKVDLPDFKTKLAGWTRVYDAVGGALTWHVLFEDTRKASDKIASGWDGDRVQVWTRGKDKLVVAEIRFRDDETAECFEKQLERVYRETWNADKKISDLSAKPLMLDARGDTLRVERAGGRVVFYRGALPSAVTGIAEPVRARPPVPVKEESDMTTIVFVVAGGAVGLAVLVFFSRRSAAA